MTPRPIWIDTDPGFDDLVTLALTAHHRSSLPLIGVSVVAGNAPLERTLHNALVVAETFEITAPIYAGCARPLVRPSVSAENVLGVGAFGTVGAKLPEPLQMASDGHGALRLLEAARRMPGELTLVAIGPLTNIALAMQLEPALPKLLREIVIMGGSSERGNHTAAAEFNFYADPEAVSVVLDSGAQIALFGLNLTRQVLLSPPHIERVRRGNSSHATALADMMAHYLQIRRGAAMPLHDPVTVAYLLHPELFELQAANVQIELTGTHTLGMSVCEFRVPARGEANTRVAINTQGEAVIEIVLEALT